MKQIGPGKSTSFGGLSQSKPDDAARILALLRAELPDDETLIDFGTAVFIK
jgi:hypothetical protein